ncbi:MAG: hypothetical protein R3C01_07275 [Planctomycetaceae bacterium]
MRVKTSGLQKIAIASSCGAMFLLTGCSLAEIASDALLINSHPKAMKYEPPQADLYDGNPIPAYRTHGGVI